MDMGNVLRIVRISIDWHKFQIPTIKNFIMRQRYKKVECKWRADIEINQRKLDDSVVRDKNFKWTHLMIQEINMWIRLGEQVTVEDFQWMCDRRGFDYPMRVYLIDMMIYVGLGKNLSYELLPGYESEVNNQ